MSLKDAKDIIDRSTFDQILEMDDDQDEREFSREIVLQFFTQAEGTIKDMEKSISQRNLAELSQFGHFLKGSSATLGLTKVKDACEAIQHLGTGLDEYGKIKLSEPQECLTRIKKKLDTMKVDYQQVKTFLKDFYHMSPEAAAP